MYNSAKREIVIEASNDHYDTLHNAIKTLIEEENDLSITLAIKFNNVSVDLDLSESLIVVNTLAVKRAAIRGGLWSTAGKRVEKPLMHTLCLLFDVKKGNYSYELKNTDSSISEFEREVDFYLMDSDNKHKCEVKLMGKGNPESADAVIARDSKVFIADKLSELNKKQLNSRKVEWVELRAEKGFERFESVLRNLGIPYTKFTDKLEDKLESIFKEIF